MKYFIYFVIFVCLLVAQISLLAFFPGNTRPDILLLGIIVLGMREGGIPAMITACVVGFVKDTFTTSFLGASMLGLVIAAFMAGNYKHIQVKLGTQSKLVLFSIIILVYNFIYYFLFELKAGMNIFDLLLNSVFPAVFYTLLFAGIAHFLIPHGLLGTKR
ncbi:MAG: rod shape-determining protein MreD [Deferribacteres bacterium]|nr:rod shape-determining protein MreD [candidate division KSB1 bacterium]MCB9503338.1 rod shape-determining protein MreD [Deferribacteres bacterium]